MRSLLTSRSKAEEEPTGIDSELDCVATNEMRQHISNGHPFGRTEIVALRVVIEHQVIAGMRCSSATVGGISHGCWFN